MKVIIPCAGKSSRFPDMPPKWMLPDHEGYPMVRRALEGLGMPPENLIIAILRTDDEKFSAQEGLRRALGDAVQCVVLDEPTASQSETVVQALIKGGVNEPFLVKDSDNFFELEFVEEPHNYVTVSSLNDFDHINARNKSYIQVDQEDIITNIREKNVISDLFSVGGYYFTEPEEFVRTFNKLREAGSDIEGELYISEVIGAMILAGHSFRAKRAFRYRDWGTVNEWREELQHRRALLVSVDGFLFERGSEFFAPLFHEVKAISGAVEAISRLAAAGQKVIYVSVRPRRLEELTQRQLRSAGLPEGPIILDCGSAQWTLLTSPHPTLPFITSDSIEIEPNDPNLLDKLGLDSSR